MIQSMTGYGKAVVTYGEKKISVEIKSLNSKSLDLSTRIVPLYREKEMEIRQLIAAKLERGKVDFTIWIEKEAGADATPVNAALVENYYRQVKDIAARTGIPEPQDWFAMLLRMPDVLTKTEQETLGEDEWEAVRMAIGDAIARLIDFRRQEGEALQRKFAEKISNISALLAAIEPYEKQRVEKIKARIIEGLKAIPEVEYDKNRLEQELIYYIEKLDINEENQRHNLVYEAQNQQSINESVRHNKQTESISWATLDESRRHNIQTENIGWANVAELNRHNIQTEQIGWGNLAESRRHNKAQESISQQQVSLGWYNASIAAKNAETNAFNAYTNMQNANTQAYRAENDARYQVQQNAQGWANLAVGAVNAIGNVIDAVIPF